MKNCPMLILILGVLAGVAGAAPCEDFKRLDKKNAETYSQEVIANVCGNYFRNNRESRFISARVMQNLSQGKWFWESMTWTPQEIYEATMCGLVDYVEEHTFDLAKKETGHCEVTHRITEEVRNELLSKMNYAAEFKAGALQEYVGTGLEQKIRSLGAHYLPAWQRIPKRYDTINCCGCNGRFSQGSQWTYLVCGHNVCIPCAVKLSHSKEAHCPLCRWPINGAALGYKLTTPHAARHR